MKSPSLSVVALSVLTILAGCGQVTSEEKALRERWEREAHGKIAFFTGRFLGRKEPALCVMDVSTHEVSTVLSGDSIAFSPLTAPQWGRDQRMILFISGSGVYKLDTLTGETQVVPIEKARCGSPLGYGSNELSSSDDGQPLLETIAVGRATGNLYVVRRTGSVGRGDLSAAVTDSAGNESPLGDFDAGIFNAVGVSPDERWVAFAEETRFHIWDRTEKLWLTPDCPADYDRFIQPSFSPDRRSLALLVRGGEKSSVSAILVSRAPWFSDWQVLCRWPNRFPWSLCWSPDGQWMLVTVTRRAGPLMVFDLVAVDAKTGRSLELDKVFLQRGHPAPEIYVGGCMDWTE